MRVKHLFAVFVECLAFHSKYFQFCKLSIRKDDALAIEQSYYTCCESVVHATFIFTCHENVMPPFTLRQNPNFLFHASFRLANNVKNCLHKQNRIKTFARHKHEAATPI